MSLAKKVLESFNKLSIKEEIITTKYNTDDKTYYVVHKSPIYGPSSSEDCEKYIRDSGVDDAMIIQSDDAFE